MAKDKVPELPTFEAVKQSISDRKVRTKENAVNEIAQTETAADRMNVVVNAVIRMSAVGYTPAEIAKELKLTRPRVSVILGSKSVQAEIYRVQEEHFTKDPQRMFMKILPGAVRTARRIMNDKSEKGSVRIDAAFKFMDRALGKPTQPLEHNSSSLKELLQAIDKMQRNGPDPEKPIDAEFKDVSAPTEEKNEEPKDEFDNWVSKNL